LFVIVVLMVKWYDGDVERLVEDARWWYGVVPVAWAWCGVLYVAWGARIRRGLARWSAMERDEEKKIGMETGVVDKKELEKTIEDEKEGWVIVPASTPL
jgi:hypothetical protein